MGKTTMAINLEQIINKVPKRLSTSSKEGIVLVGLALTSLLGVALDAKGADNVTQKECNTSEQAKMYFKDIVDDYFSDVLFHVLDEYSETPLGYATVKIKAIGPTRPRSLSTLTTKFERDFKRNYSCWASVYNDALTINFKREVSGWIMGTEENCGEYVEDEYEFTGDGQSTGFRVYLDPNAEYQIECTRGAPGVLERHWEGEDGTHRSDTRGDNQRYRPVRDTLKGNAVKVEILMSDDRQIGSRVRTTMSSQQKKN